MVVNRRLTQTVVERYAQAMRDGLWLTDGSPIRFNTKGRLVDGQHRLWAVIESGVSIQVMVARNVPDEAFLVMDTGRTRGFADVLSIQYPDTPNVLQVAATVRMAYRFKRGLAVSSIVSSRGRAIENATLLDFYGENMEAILYATRLADRIYTAFPRALPASAWSLFALMVAELDVEDAEDFATHLMSGKNLGEGSSILALRAVLAEEMVKPTRPKHEILGLAIKAWNFYRDGTHVQRLLMRLGGANPETYPVAR